MPTTPSPQYADVVFNLPVKDIFTYEIPTELRGLVQAGMRVFVPFGRRRITGYVVSLREKPEKNIPIKPIEDLPDTFPAITGELLALTRWMAGYYNVSWGEAIKAALPAGADDESREILNITDKGRKALESGNLTASAREILEMVPDKPDLTAKILQRLLKKKFSPHSLTKLKHDGYLTGEIMIRRSSVGYSYQKMVRANQGIDPEKTDKLLSRTPSQKALYQLIAEQETSTAELLKQKPSYSNLLRELKKKSLIETFSIKIPRGTTPGAKELSPKEKERPPRLTAEQEKVFSELRDCINTEKFKTFLLHGVTGSGKTEIYLRCIEKVLQMGKTGIMMVPEISLTPQTVSRFQKRFGDQVAVLHSGLSNSERYLEWMKIRDGRVSIVVGARSAVFAPFKNPGIIVIDEEHDSSYKQESTPRYHARDTAIVRAREQNAVVILGSATPSMESRKNAESGKYALLSLTKRIGQALLPTIKLVDMRREKEEMKNFSILSGELNSSILQRLKHKEQVFLFLNRRGTANYVSCKECGFVFHCARCSVTLTFHGDERSMRCHYCNYKVRVPGNCSDCRGEVIKFSGFGTKKLEAEITRIFPQARVTRMDRDTTRGKTAFETIYQNMTEGNIDILIGTQMITKGHDFPNVTLVGVINADISLNIPDFRSCERTFQLLTQVAGRAGRGRIPGQVIIQTQNPDHYVYDYVRGHDYELFYKREIQLRQRLNFPPFTRLVAIEIESERERSGQEQAEKLKISLARILKKVRGVELLGPSRAALYLINNRFRWRLLLRSSRAGALQEVLSQCGDFLGNQKFNRAKAKLTIDVDPVNML